MNNFCQYFIKPIYKFVLLLGVGVALVGCGGSSGGSTGASNPSKPSSSASFSGTNEASGEIGPEATPSLMYSTGVSSARLDGPLLGDESGMIAGVVSLPVSYESSVPGLQPIAAYVSRDSRGTPDELYLVFQNTGSIVLCEIYMDLAYVTGSGISDPRFKSVNLGTLGSSRNSTTPVDGVARRNINSGCIAPNESVYTHQTILSLSDEEENDIVGIAITELEASPGDLVQGLSLQPIVYRVADSPGRSLFDIDVVNNGTIAFPIGRIEILAIDESGFPVDRNGGIPDRIDGGPDLLEPGETAVFREQLAQPGAVSTIRVIVKATNLVLDVTF